MIALHLPPEPLDVGGVDPAEAPGDLLEARDHQALAILDALHEVGRLQERFERAGIEPRGAAAEQFHRERLLGEVGTVDVGDLELPARGRLEARRDVDHLRIVEVQPGHRIGRARMRRLLFQADRVPFAIELDDPVAFRILHGIAKDGGAPLPRRRPPQQLRQARSVEDVVSECQGNAIRPDELTADEEGLRQPFRRGLHGIGELHAEVVSGSKQLPETGLIGRCRDDQNLPDAREHQRGERVVDEGLAIDRHQLLRHRSRQRIQPGTAAAGKHDALQRHAPQPSTPRKLRNPRAGRASCKGGQVAACPGASDKWPHSSINSARSATPSFW